jgi:hypothetical protein
LITLHFNTLPATATPCTDAVEPTRVNARRETAELIWANERMETLLPNLAHDRVDRALPMLVESITDINPSLLAPLLPRTLIEDPSARKLTTLAF